MGCLLNKRQKSSPSEYFPSPQGRRDAQSQQSLQCLFEENLCNQRSVEHAENENTRSILREERFNSNINLRISSFADEQDGGVFLSLTADYFMFSSTPRTCQQLLARAQMLSDKVAEGIIDEGLKMNQTEIAKRMAEQINQVKNGTEEKIWECFLRLYCMESFLYRRLNEIMQQAADKPDKKLWESSIPIYGSFAYVLWQMGPVCTIKDMTVYRGIYLTDHHLEQYQKNCPNNENSRSKHDDNSLDLDKPNFHSTFSFPTFTKTSRCRSKAEQFGNSLLIIKINNCSGWDVSCYSKFNEEEYLLKPGLRFWIQSCIFDKIKNKWIIHLKYTF